MPIQIVNFYKFFKLTPEQLPEIEKNLYALASRIDEIASQKLACRGLCILGVEGANATFSLPQNHAEAFMQELLRILPTSDISFKKSFADKHPFHDFNVKIRDEIVTLSRPDLVPNGEHRHLSPTDWHQVMQNEDVVVVDTRNSYEYAIGHFKGAVNPQIEEFSEFPEWLKNSSLPKEKKVLIYCTGGIRCEKAILEMEEQGFQNVFQLDGGILNYLEHYPNEHFKGDCFVFDYRVAVDQNLNPSTAYRLCPHCGQPAKTPIVCVQCGLNDIVCDVCLAKGEEFKTCSKNCTHHKRLGHKTKRIHQDAFNRRRVVSPLK